MKILVPKDWETYLSDYDTWQVSLDSEEPQDVPDFLRLMIDAKDNSDLRTKCNMWEWFTDRATETLARERIRIGEQRKELHRLNVEISNLRRVLVKQVSDEE